MRFFIDELEVFFPYTYIYPEQFRYMQTLKKSLDAKGECILEMPSGTGKTVSLLALITSYLAVYPERTKKLLYCSRTVSEIEKAVEELKRVVAYRDQELGGASSSSSSSSAPPFTSSNILCIALSSRRNLCIHPTVVDRKRAFPPSSTEVDSKCRDLTASWVREDPDAEKCSWFEDFQTKKARGDSIMRGIYTLEDLRAYGQRENVCPYFLAREMVVHSNIVIFSYQYLIDPKISQLIMADIDSKTSIVVFDEAHNIDSTCIDSLSVTLTKRIMERSRYNMLFVDSHINQVKQTDANKLQQEYQALVQGFQPAIASSASSLDAQALPILPDHIVREAMPGNIRKAEHFMSFLQRFLDYLFEFFHQRVDRGEFKIFPPKVFAREIMEKECTMFASMRFCAARLQSLLRTLQIKEIQQFSPISIICDFATLISTYDEGFVLIIENNNDEPILQFCCLDASLAMAPILRNYRNVIVTSGTISPLDMFKKILKFTSPIQESLKMSLYRECICPVIVTQGNDQIPIDTSFKHREDQAIIRNYGTLVTELCTIVPDGVICFFPSYGYMEKVINAWNRSRVLDDLQKKKLIFVETPDTHETSVAILNYRQACDCGRGALLFSVARGKVSEGIDFDHHYGRCVIVIGVPNTYSESLFLKARQMYLQEHYNIKDHEFMAFDAMRQVSQCVGRVIRGKSDYGVMIFADHRFSKPSKRDKLPQWILQFLTDERQRTTIEVAASIVRNFLIQIAQPSKQKEEFGVSLWDINHVLAQTQSQTQLQIQSRP